MNTFLQKTFLQEPGSNSAAYRYGFLGLILALFAYILYLPGDWNLRAVTVPLMLLLNHLAFQFRWPRRLAITLRVIALAWVIGGGIYIFARILTR